MNDAPAPSFTPQGHVLVEQRLRPDGAIELTPPVPVSAVGTLQVWNPWQGAWEKPKYLVNGCPAWLCYDEEMDQ